MSKPVKAELSRQAEETRRLIDRAQSGDASAMPALQALLDDVPNLRRALGGDLEATVEFSFARSMGGKENLAFHEALKRKLAALRQELEGPTPSPIERLLVDRVVACWLQIQEADIRYAQSEDTSPARLTFYIKRQDRANARFLAAMKTLATVRKLALPALQVNIANNQVNLAG